jgi:predicted transposase YdaD
MPRVMILYELMEIVIRPRTTYMLLESMSPVRRIYTDGRDWSKESDPQFNGYSIGTWLDTDGDGT